jgi:hypothetical protein
LVVSTTTIDSIADGAFFTIDIGSAKANLVTIGSELYGMDSMNCSIQIQGSWISTECAGRIIFNDANGTLGHVATLTDSSIEGFNLHLFEYNGVCSFDMLLSNNTDEILIFNTHNNPTMISNEDGNDIITIVRTAGPLGIHLNGGNNTISTHSKNYLAGPLAIYSDQSISSFNLYDLTFAGIGDTFISLYDNSHGTAVIQVSPHAVLASKANLTWDRYRAQIIATHCSYQATD